MIRILATIAAIPLLFGLYSSLEDSASVTGIRQSLSSLTEQDSSPSPFSLGNDRTVNDAFNSSAFTYDGKRF